LLAERYYITLRLLALQFCHLSYVAWVHNTQRVELLRNIFHHIVARQSGCVVKKTGSAKIFTIVFSQGSGCYIQKGCEKSRFLTYISHYGTNDTRYSYRYHEKRIGTRMQSIQ